MNYMNENTKRLSPYIPGEQPKFGESVIKLNTNENAYPPAPEVVDALKYFCDEPEILKLYPSSDAYRLREALATEYKMKAENFACGNGSDEILSYVFYAFVEEGRRIILTNPTYTLYQTLANRLGFNVEVVETRDDFSVDLSLIPRDENVVFFLANPNAQTSRLINTADIEDFLSSFKGLMILDEAYADFARENSLALISKFDNLIITRTFSKSFSLCGIRLGFAVSNPKLIDAFSRVKDSYNINAITQEIGIRAIKNSAYAYENCAKIIEEREALSKILSEMGSLVLPSEANFIMVKPTQVGAEKLYVALKERNIYIRYFNTPRLKDFVRITVGNSRENALLIEAIKDICKA